MGVLCLVFCFVIQYLVLLSLDEEERAVCFILIVFLVPCDCKCFVTLPRDTVGWPAVCNCGISWSYKLIFVVYMVK